MSDVRTGLAIRYDAWALVEAAIKWCQEKTHRTDLTVEFYDPSYAADTGFAPGCKAILSRRGVCDDTVLADIEVTDADVDTWVARCVYEFCQKARYTEICPSLSFWKG